jgi:hypothetical protein
MNEKQRQPHDCEPVTENPAPQPKPPGGTCTDPPVVDDPTWKPQPCPPTDCCCPPGPTSTTNCLQDLIDEQTQTVTAAEKAAKFKEELVKFLDSAKNASLAYNRDKYDDLIKRWVEQDAAIVKQLYQLTCVVRCWKCVVECHVCPAIDRIKMAERWLYGDGTLPSTPGNLNDLLYWHTRNRDAKQRAFDRVDAVLKAWGAPAAAIDKALASNLSALNALKISSEPGKAVYDLLLKIVPLHLAIAPPQGSKWTTGIDKKYTEFCGCDDPPPADDCCGPDVGPMTIRRRITGPQPYLIDPNEYFTLICCLVEKKYRPARQALMKADAELTKVQNQIAARKAELDGIKDFEKNVRPTVPSVIDCCDYTCDDDDEQPKRRQGC